MARSFRNLVAIPSDATTGELMADLSAIAADEDEDAADAYKAKLVTLRIWTLAEKDESEPIEESELVVAQNIGYLSGYCSTEERHRICRVFATTHPIFGDKDPTPDEAFQMGQDWAEAAKREEDDGREQRRIVLGVPRVRRKAHVPQGVPVRPSRGRIQQPPHFCQMLWKDFQAQV